MRDLAATSVVYIAFVVVAFLCIGLGLFWLSDDDNTPRVEDRVQYVKDARTGLCFATAGSALVTVPCTQAVEATINRRGAR